MASLIDVLISTLEQENTEYEGLLELGLQKTGIIIRNEVDELSRMVEKEQLVVDRIMVLEKKRTEVSQDIAEVLNKDVKTLTLTRLIELLSSQKKERDALVSIHDKLSLTMKRMVEVNERNKALLNESMEMLQFEMNLVQSIKRGPETNNYGRDAYISNNYTLPNTRFDRKQ
ncbi:MAG: flagellar protein FlgN [Lachnospiraceae bacterium]